MPPLRGELAPVKVVRAQNLRTARPVNKNYRLLNILRNADVNKVVLLSYGRPSSAVAELLFSVSYSINRHKILQYLFCIIVLIQYYTASWVG